MNWIGFITQFFFQLAVSAIALGFAVYAFALRRDRDRWRDISKKLTRAIKTFQDVAPDYEPRDLCDCATYYPNCPDNADEWCIYKRLYDAVQEAHDEAQTG